MSPTTEKTWSPGKDESPTSASVEQPANNSPVLYDPVSPAPDDQDLSAMQSTPDEALQDEENNPWRNHEDDQHKWLGLLLAAVGFGAIGYLIGGV